MFQADPLSVGIDLSFACAILSSSLPILVHAALPQVCPILEMKTRDRGSRSSTTTLTHIVKPARAGREPGRELVMLFRANWRAVLRLLC